MFLFKECVNIWIRGTPFTMTGLFSQGDSKIQDLVPPGRNSASKLHYETQHVNNSFLTDLWPIGVLSNFTLTRFYHQKFFKINLSLLWTYKQDSLKNPDWSLLLLLIWMNWLSIPHASRERRWQARVTNAIQQGVHTEQQNPPKHQACSDLTIWLVPRIKLLEGLRDSRFLQ